jgi:hypothetical protein
MTTKTDEVITDLRSWSTKSSNLLTNLDTTKAQGSDGIPPRLLKGNLNKLLQFLWPVFGNRLHSNRMEPSKRYTHSQEKLCRTCDELPPHFSAAYSFKSSWKQRYIFNNVYPFLYVLINNVQHGFLTNWFCVTQPLAQLLSVIKVSNLSLDQNKQVDVLYLDFSKACIWLCGSRHSST